MLRTVATRRIRPAPIPRRHLVHHPLAVVGQGRLRREIPSVRAVPAAPARHPLVTLLLCAGLILWMLITWDFGTDGE